MKYLKLIPLLALVASGCADAASTAGADALAVNNGSRIVEVDPAAQTATDALFARDIPAARAALQDASTPREFAGKAVVETLYVPLAPETQRLLRDSLGATRDVTAELLYGDTGLFYLISRGVPWADSDSYAGIRTQLADKLPWQSRRLDSPDAFLEDLREPVDLLMESLVAVADGPLAAIRSAAAQGLGSEETFDPFRLPGAVFFDEDLTLDVGRSELALLDAAVAGVQGAIYGLAAYEHSWTLERAFGTEIWSEVALDPQNPEFVDGFTVEDYQVAYLNERLLKRIATAKHLSTARNAFEGGLTSFEETLRVASQSPTEGTFAWIEARNDVGAEAYDAALSDFAEIVAAVRASLRGSTVLPHVSPQVTLNLSLLFEDGRTLPDDVDFIVFETYMDEFGTTRYSEVNQAALDVLLDGVVHPPLSELDVDFTHAETIGTVLDVALSTYTGEVERAVENF